MLNLPLSLVTFTWMAQALSPMQALAERRDQEAVWQLQAAGGPTAELARGVEENLLHLLRSPVRAHRRLREGISTVYLVELANGRRGIFKPAGMGEEGLAQNPGQEVAAWRLDKLLDLRVVPATVMREVETLGRGSVQIFMEHTEAAGAIAERQGTPVPVAGEIQLLDALIHNPDRHPRNYLVTRGGRQVAIDHNFAFHTGFESDRWAWPEADAAALFGVPGHCPRLIEVTRDKLDDVLGGLLPEASIAAVHARLQRLQSACASAR